MYTPDVHPNAMNVYDVLTEHGDWLDTWEIAKRTGTNGHVVGQAVRRLRDEGHNIEQRPSRGGRSREFRA